MLYLGLCGLGNRIGIVYIELVKNDMMKLDKWVKVDFIFVCFVKFLYLEGYLIWCDVKI